MSHVSARLRRALVADVSRHAMAVVLAATLLPAAANADTVEGTVGNDVLVGGSGATTMNGGGGNDTLFSDLPGRVTPFSGWRKLGLNPDGSNSTSGFLVYPGAFFPDGRTLLINSHASTMARNCSCWWEATTKDLGTGAGDIVSTHRDGNVIQGSTWHTMVSRFGNAVAFSHTGTFGATGDTNSAYDAYFKDLKKGTLKPASVTKEGVFGNGESWVFPDPNFDGKRVLFYTRATNLSTTDRNGNGWDIYMKDTSSGKLTHISTSQAGLGATSGESYYPQMSPDGSSVLFESGANTLAPGDSGYHDILVKNIKDRYVTKISTNSFGVAANSTSSWARWSPDGRRIVFHSHATNLVTGDTNGKIDIFIKDLDTDGVTRVSTNAAGQELDGDSAFPQFSPDGRRVLFASKATNAVSGTSNGFYQLYLKDLDTGQIIRLTENAAGEIADRDVTWTAAFSPDGKQIAISTWSDKLDPDSVEEYETYLIDLPNGAGADDTINGGAGNDRMYSGVGNDTLIGESGNDILDGGVGADNMIGGIDNDLYFVDNVGDTVTELIGGGKDSVRSRVSFTLDLFVENVTLEGEANIDATGNKGKNNLIGNAGNNTIRGEDGKDFIEGGAGADTLFGGKGKDTVSYFNSPEAVNVNLAIMKVSGGHAQGDEIAEFENILGSGRNDALVGDAGNNTIDGSYGNDTIRGGDGGDTLIGGMGNDQIFGEEGADKITGGLGADLIVPGMGEGKIIWRAVNESPKDAGDTVANYDPVNGPKLDLAKIDANTTTTKNDAFLYIGGDAFSNVPGQLRFANEKLLGDVDGDGTADFEVNFPDVVDPIPLGKFKL